MSRRRVSRYTLAAEFVLCVLLALVPLSLGGAPSWTLWPLGLLSALCLGLVAVGAHRQKQSLGFPLLAALPAVGALACLLQIIPLPTGLLQLLSAPAAELQAFALTPLGLTAPRPLSLDPPSTWRELAKHLSYLAVLLAAVQLGRSQAARRRVLTAPAGTGIVVALIGLGHELLGAETLFGLFRYSVRPPLLTTFGNPNHLAGYLLLSSSLCLGLLLTASHRNRALGWGLGYLISGAALLMSLSRGGMVFFLFAQLLLGALVVWRRREEDHARGARRLGQGALIVAGVSAVFAVGAYVAYERLALEWSTADSLEKLQHSKVELWPMMWDGARPFALAGMGRGAYELAFTRFQNAYPSTTFTHPENLILHWVSEFGFPVALALFAIGLHGLYRLLRQERMDALQLSVLAAVTGLLLHNLFDFNLEYPACAVTVAAMVGVVVRSDENHALRRISASAGLWVPAAILTLVTFAITQGRPTAADTETELLAAMQGGESGAPLRQRALTAIDRHPADYLLYGLMGHHYSGRAEPREALAFANRALFLRPLDAEAHRTAARALIRLGHRDQAFLEYRLAYVSGFLEVLGEALSQAQGVGELRRLVPTEPKPLAELIAQLRPSRRLEALELLDWALEETQEHADAASLWILSARYRLEDGNPAAAMVAIEEAQRRDPDDVQVYLVKASVLAAQGQNPQAITLLQSLITQHPEHVELGFALCEHWMSAGRHAAAREALTRLSPFISDLGQRIRLMTTEGLTYEREGRFNKALNAYVAAAQLQPHNPALHYQVARLYEQVGRHADALQSVRAGLSRDQPSAGERHQVWIERLEKKQKAHFLERDKLLLEGDSPAP